MGVSKVRDALTASPGRFGVAYAVTDEHLLILGETVSCARLVTGGSAVALGLPRNFFRCGYTLPFKPVQINTPGPDAILAGSCSEATRDQIAVHSRRHPVLAIDVPGAMRHEVTPTDLVEFIRANTGNAPVVYSSNVPEETVRVQNRWTGGRGLQARDPVCPNGSPTCEAGTS